jgi:hypothetical protein
LNKDEALKKEFEKTTRGGSKKSPVGYQGVPLPLVDLRTEICDLRFAICEVGTKRMANGSMANGKG